jgi:hypothetical protein
VTMGELILMSGWMSLTKGMAGPLAGTSFSSSSRGLTIVAEGENKSWRGKEKRRDELEPGAVG